MSAPTLDWNDRAVCAAWLADVAGHVDDAFAAARDQLRPLRRRRLGRLEVRRLLAEAEDSLRAQLAYAHAGLSPDEPPHSSRFLKTSSA